MWCNLNSFNPHIFFIAAFGEQLKNRSFLGKVRLIFKKFVLFLLKIKYLKNILTDKTGIIFLQSSVWMSHWTKNTYDGRLGSFTTEYSFKPR